MWGLLEPPPREAKPIVIPAAGTLDALLDQLEALFDHVAQDGCGGCSMCERYAIVHEALMRPFKKARGVGC